MMARPTRERKAPVRLEPWQEGDAVPMAMRKKQSRMRAAQRERNQLHYDKKKKAAAALAEQARKEKEAAAAAADARKAAKARRTAAAAKRAQSRKERRERNANLPHKPKRNM